MPSAFLRVLTLENGLAQSHFRWPRPRREALRAAAPWLALIVMPTLFVLRCCCCAATPSPIDTVGRLLLALSVIGVAAVAWRLFAPGPRWTVRGTVLVEPLRLRQASARLLLAAMARSWLALVLRGYFVTVHDAERARHRLARRAAR